MWTSANLGDVMSDMSVLHRVDDIRTQRASSFFPRAERLMFYSGAVRGAELMRQSEKEKAEQSGGQPYTPRSEVQNVPAAAIASDDWIERA